ncbi:hypothetical protein B0H17DRAFT_1097640 [Mycena rosella]|uniref:Uncharacterized protein n=1 Tax=Mycena rosella TaxID=1033263 RepID=A0AAD7G1Y0_MYCRO|nr:hypothetical protein B0H17DRAFT_1097640 [Mycena rosella]
MPLLPSVSCITLPLLPIPTSVSPYYRPNRAHCPARTGRASCHIVGGRERASCPHVGRCIVRRTRRARARCGLGTIPLVVYVGNEQLSPSFLYTLRLRPVRAVIPLSRVLPNPPHHRHAVVRRIVGRRVGGRAGVVVIPSQSVDDVVLAYAEPGSRIPRFVFLYARSSLSSPPRFPSPPLRPKERCSPGSGLKGQIRIDATRGCSM